MASSWFIHFHGRMMKSERMSEWRKVSLLRISIKTRKKQELQLEKQASLANYNGGMLSTCMFTGVKNTILLSCSLSTCALVVYESTYNGMLISLCK